MSETPLTSALNHPLGYPKAGPSLFESSILDAIQSPVLYFDTTGLLVHANQYAVNCFSLGVATAKSFDQIGHFWDDPLQRQQDLLAVIDTATAVWRNLERALIDGVEHWYHVDKVPTKSVTGDVEGVVLVIHDVSDNIRRELALKESEARYRAFIENSSDAIWRYDICPPIDISLPVKKQAELLEKRAILVECNQKLAELFEVEKIDDVIGMPLHSNGSLTNHRDILKFIKNEYRLENGEFIRNSLLGEKSYIQNSAIGIVENGFLTRTWGTSRDITIQKSYLDHVEFMATHDELTLLPNRTLLYRNMEEALKSVDRQQMALLLFDLDKFKEINDTLGHLAGDKLLREIGPRLELEMSGLSGTIARLGGDEFAIFLPNIRNVQQAVVMGHRFISAICEPFELGGVYSEVSASVGIAVAPNQARDVNTLMRYADVAMYHAKQSYKGVAIYDSQYDPYSPARLEITGALRKAIRDKELCLHYQPKLCLKTNRVNGYEALVRWFHEDYGAVPPSEFVPIAESSNMVYPLTVWVMRETIKQCARWIKQGKVVTMAMNLSPRNLVDERIVTDLKSTLEEFSVDGRYFEMEITESMIMHDPQRAQKALDQISELGVRLSVDDYGTGYSSLAYLKKLPVQAIKIDMSFVKNMLEVEQDAIIVNSTIQLAHNLGLEVVAEGVESLAVLERLKSLGCDYAQGYYVAKPMSADDIDDWSLEHQEIA